MADVIPLDTHAFLEWLLSCESREEMHNAIRAWLHAHPRPPTNVEIMARIDDALAGWYQAYYDPRRVAQGFAELEVLAERIVRESGCRDEFDAAAWVRSWAHEPHPALGGRCPVYLLSTPEGVAEVRSLLLRQQSAAFS